MDKRAVALGLLLALIITVVSILFTRLSTALLLVILVLASLALILLLSPWIRDGDWAGLFLWALGKEPPPDMGSALQDGRSLSRGRIRRWKEQVRNASFATDLFNGKNRIESHEIWGEIVPYLREETKNYIRNRVLVTKEQQQKARNKVLSDLVDLERNRGD